MANDSWVQNAGKFQGITQLEEDVTTTYEVEENGRKIQFHKGKNGRRIITDLGREPADLKRAFDLLGDKVIRFESTGKVVEPRKRGESLSVPQPQVSVPLASQNTEVSGTNVRVSEVSGTKLAGQETLSGTCEVCGNTYIKQRSTSKFCSDACRKKFARSRT